MEKKSSMNNPIKITILDLFPSLNELNPKHEEMLLIFQGLNSFFNLKEVLTSKKKIEIENTNQSPIIISLIKSNNIIAAGYINIKQGEQWITLNYENKNKKMTTNLALSLIDCVKLKIFCDIKNKNPINTTFNNININNSALNINTNVNYTNRNNNKTKHVISQMNLKISKRNTNKILSKGSPIKTSYNKISNRRSPNKNLYDINNNIKMPNNNDELNTNNLIKSNNFNTFNYMSVNINMNPYTTISKCNIKKIDLNSSNKTRNSKIAKKKSTNDNYTSLRTTNNNYGIKKMNTSTCSLTTINKNKNNKKSRLTPDIETKEIKNGKNVGGSPGPNYSRKKKLDMDIDDNLERSNDKSPFYNVKMKNFPIKQIRHSNEEENIAIINKIKRKPINYSNNIINENNFNNNHINLNTNKNISNNNINKNNNKCRTINDNNFNNTFNNTFNNINKQVIKNKLLYNTKTNNNQQHIHNINNTINSNSTNTTKKNNDLEGSANSFDEEEKNKTKESSKICDKGKIGIYTTKRIDIKKNNNQIINKKIKDQENKKITNKLSHKILVNSGDFNSIENNINKNEKLDNKDKDKENSNELNINVNEKDDKKIEENNKENIDNNNINDINDNIENENEYDENDNYTRIKEDFILLYNDDYVQNIQDDLLNLEIELFIEKMTELISCYHMHLEEKRLENELLDNEFNSNLSKYKEINKLIKKLEMKKIDYDIKYLKANNNQKPLNKQNKIDLIVNKTEIEIFKNIFPKNENKERLNILKGIMMNVLKKEDNRNILSDDENFINWINLCNIKKEKEKNKTKDKIASAQRQKQTNNSTYNESSYNNIDKNMDKNNNFLKNNNSYYNLDNTYKKKLPISPIYPKNNKFIPSTEVANNKTVKEY